MKKIIWVLLDNRMGSVGQARGVMSELDKDKFEIVEKKIEYNRLAGLPNCLRGRTLLGLTKQSRMLFGGQMPDVVLSTSRRTVPVARYIKKMSAEKTKLVQLMHPGSCGLNEFSLVFVPEHDKAKKGGDNIRYIVGCPHRINKESLAEAHNKWQQKFADTPRPLTAVVVGGAIKNRPFSVENATQFGKMLAKFHQEVGGSFLLTTSRRTGEAAQNAILEQIKGIESYNYLWGNKDENPYMGFLSEADNIVVTGDSVSMCSEAVGTGKPVYVFVGQKWLTSKHLRFVNSLLDKKLAFLFSGKPTSEKNVSQMFNPAGFIASEISLIV